MTYLELQNEVLSDRFAEVQRPKIKNWLNYRYGRLWGMEDWTFKFQDTTLSVNAGASSVARGTIGTIISLLDSTISPYMSPEIPTRPEDFYALTSSVVGKPYNFTVVGDNIVFDRPMAVNRTFRVLSEAKFTPLVADADVPLIPSEYHLLLASGAASHGLRLENDPSWQAFEDEWQRGIDDMKKNYFSSVRIYADSLPSWP